MDNFLGRNDEQMQCRGILHIVKKGDTLYKISKMHGVPLSRIMYANPYVDVYNLQVGDEICVPVMTPRVPLGTEHTGGMMEPARESVTGGMMEPAREGVTGGMMEPAREGVTGGMMEPAREGVAGGMMPAPGSRIPYSEEERVEDIRRSVRENRMDEVRETMEERQAREWHMPGQESYRWNAMPQMPGNCSRNMCAKTKQQMPWNNTGVNEDMMKEYLRGAPKQEEPR